MIPDDTQEQIDATQEELANVQKQVDALKTTLFTLISWQLLHLGDNGIQKLYDVYEKQLNK